MSMRFSVNIPLCNPTDLHPLSQTDVARSLILIVGGGNVPSCMLVQHQERKSFRPVTESCNTSSLSFHKNENHPETIVGTDITTH